MLLAVAMSSLWILGQQSALHVRMASDPLFSASASAGVYAVLAILGIVLLNGLLIAAETAVDLLRPIHVKHVKEVNSKQGDRLSKLCEDKAKYVAACTFASHVARVGMVLTGMMLAPGVAGWLNKQFGWNIDFLGAAALVSLPILLLNLVVELVPKSYAVLHPHRVSMALYRFIVVTTALLSAPANVVRGIAGLLTARFGGQASFRIENQAEEEIKTLVESAQETGEIEVDEKELLHSVFEFTDTVAREVMTPRVDVDAMPVTSDPADVIALIQETGHSRIPLYEDTDDQIVGIIHAKDLLMAMLDGKSKVNLRSLMRPAIFVPENKNLHELLSDLRSGRSQLAVVQDEFGGTAGIVTIEDIVEELVGDIMDEYDVEEPEIVPDDGGFLVGGKAHVDDVSAVLGAELDSEEFDTIGGLVFGIFGRQPRLGETIESNGVKFTVVDTDGRRIHRLRVERCPEATDEEALEGLEERRIQDRA